MFLSSAQRSRLLVRWKIPYERRFGEQFSGPIFPFGSSIEYHPISLKDKAKLHLFARKVLPGIFFGYALYAGGIWKGDILVADASEIYARRLNAKEVLIPKRRDYLIFPYADGTITLAGKREEVRIPIPTRYVPDSGEC